MVNQKLSLRVDFSQDYLATFAILVLVLSARPIYLVFS